MEALQTPLPISKSQVKSPGLAAVLGFVFPWLGALYNGKFLAALLFLIIDFIFFILSFVGIGLMLLLLYGFFGAFQSYKWAKRRNEEELQKLIARQAAGDGAHPTEPGGAALAGGLSPDRQTVNMSEHAPAPKMTNDFAYAFMAALNERDAVRIANFYTHDAILVLPGDADNRQFQQVRATGRNQILQHWNSRLSRDKHPHARLEAICHGVETTALVYRLYNTLVVDVLSLTSNGLIKAARSHFSRADQGYVFLSYSRGSKVAEQLTSFLIREELPPWVDDELKLGELWDGTIKDRLAGARAFLICMDEKAAQSEYVKKELALAVSLTKPIIPILIQGEPFEELRDYQFIRWNDLDHPEYGFAEQLRDIVAPNQVPSEALRWRRVDYFVRKLLSSVVLPGEPPVTVTLGVGMNYVLPLSPDYSLRQLDELEWAEIFTEIQANVPDVDFGSLDDYKKYGQTFPTPRSLADFLTSRLDWSQIRHLGKRDARMSRTK